ncbi:DPY30 domain-containing protein 1 [Elysia marginata]|uniref:DPY30 domain-containing protein 1 n=1 Tax=Elysia marginata TaxID=1093978 RepID=A0AAV4IQ08_9GAST|nr:DPY30 domain-containing protein 1 [Elysia marginata]
MATATAPFVTSTNNDYIKRTVGPILIQVLQEVAQVRPTDPIDFIARWLYYESDNGLFYHQKVKDIADFEETRLKMEAEEKERKANVQRIKQTLKDTQHESTILDQEIEEAQWRRRQILAQTAAALAARRDAQLRAAEREAARKEEELRKQQLLEMLRLKDEKGSKASSSSPSHGSSSGYSRAGRKRRQMEKRRSSPLSTSTLTSSSSLTSSEEEEETEPSDEEEEVEEEDTSETNEEKDELEEEIPQQDEVSDLENGDGKKDIKKKILPPKGRTLIKQVVEGHLEHLKAVKKAFQEGKVDLDIQDPTLLQSALKRTKKEEKSKLKKAVAFVSGLSAASKIQKRAESSTLLPPDSAKHHGRLAPPAGPGSNDKAQLSHHELKIKHQLLTPHGPSEKRDKESAKIQRKAKTVSKRHDVPMPQTSSTTDMGFGLSVSHASLQQSTDIEGAQLGDIDSAMPPAASPQHEEGDSYEAFKRSISFLALMEEEEEPDSKSYTWTASYKSGLNASELGRSTSPHSPASPASGVKSQLKKQTDAQFVSVYPWERALRKETAQNEDESPEYEEEHMSYSSGHEEDGMVVLEDLEDVEVEEEDIEERVEVGVKHIKKRKPHVKSVKVVHRETHFDDARKQHGRARRPHRSERSEHVLRKETEHRTHSEDRGLKRRSDGKEIEYPYYDDKGLKRSSGGRKDQEVAEADSFHRRMKRKEDRHKHTSRAHPHALREQTRDSKGFISPDTETSTSREVKKSRDSERKEPEEVTELEEEEWEEEEEEHDGTRAFRKYKMAPKKKRHAAQRDGEREEFLEFITDINGEIRRVSLSKQNEKDELDEKRHRNLLKPQLVSWRCTWRQQLVCEHPTLGDMAPIPPHVTRESADLWERLSFIPQVLIDMDIYTREDDDFVELYDPFAPDLSLQDFVRRESRVSGEKKTSQSDGSRGQNGRERRSSKKSRQSQSKKIYSDDKPGDSGSQSTVSSAYAQSLDSKQRDQRNRKRQKHANASGKKKSKSSSSSRKSDDRRSSNKSDDGKSSNKSDDRKSSNKSDDRKSDDEKSQERSKGGSRKSTAGKNKNNNTACMASASDTANDESVTLTQPALLTTDICDGISTSSSGDVGKEAVNASRNRSWQKSRPLPLRAPSSNQSTYARGVTKTANDCDDSTLRKPYDTTMKRLHTVDLNSEKPYSRSINILDTDERDPANSKVSSKNCRSSQITLASKINTPCPRTMRGQDIRTVRETNLSNNSYSVKRTTATNMNKKPRDLNQRADGKRLFYEDRKGSNKQEINVTQLLSNKESETNPDSLTPSTLQCTEKIEDMNEGAIKPWDLDDAHLRITKDSVKSRALEKSSSIGKNKAKEQKTRMGSYLTKANTNNSTSFQTAASQLRPCQVLAKKKKEAFEEPYSFGDVDEQRTKCKSPSRDSNREHDFHKTHSVPWWEGSRRTCSRNLNFSQTGTGSRRESCKLKMEDKSDTCQNTGTNNRKNRDPDRSNSKKTQEQMCFGKVNSSSRELQPIFLDDGMILESTVCATRPLFGKPKGLPKKTLKQPPLAKTKDPLDQPSTHNQVHREARRHQTINDITEKIKHPHPTTSLKRRQDADLSRQNSRFGMFINGGTQFSTDTHSMEKQQQQEQQLSGCQSDVTCANQPDLAYTIEYETSDDDTDEIEEISDER